MAFEEWMKGGGWKDVAEAGNSQSEVMDPDSQVLLSRVLSFPAPPFPCL